MPKFRVIEEGGFFTVQRQVGILFPRWERLGRSGIPACVSDWESPARFDDSDTAIEFMEQVAYKKPVIVRVIATIDT